MRIVTSGGSFMRALVFVALLAFTACGPAPSVELSQPPSPAKPEPSRPTTPTTDPAGPGDGGVATQPTPTPAPSVARLRAVCVDTALGSLNMLSSAARPSDGVPRLDIRLEKVVSGGDGVISSANPVPVTSGIRDELHVLYEGAQEISVMQPGPLRILLAKVDMPMRQGVARDLAPAVALSSDVREAADRLGVQPRNIGVSDQGSYLVIPRGKALEIVSHKSLQKLATVALDPLRTVMPQIFESENLLTALVLEKGSFKVVTVKLSVQSGAVSASSPAGFAPIAGSTFSSPSWLRKGQLVWSESETKSAPGRGVTFVTYDVLTSALARARFTALVGERLSPQLAVIRARTSPLLAVVAEVSSPRKRDSLGDTRQLESGRMIYLALSAQGSVTEVASLEYPGYLIKSTQTYGFEGDYAIQRILAPSGAREALVSVDTGATGEMIFKERGGALDGVGGLSCTNPDVIEEVP